MSPKARMIMYPLLGVVVAFFLYTMFFMQPKEAPKADSNQPATEQVTEAVNTESTGK